MGKTLARWSVELIFIVVHVKECILILLSLHVPHPKLAVVCPDLTQSQIAIAQLLGTLNYSTSINREGSHLNSRNQYAIIFTWRVIHVLLWL
ncbi:unnamed protein product [Penicillium nalgiovense]|nr:unnamed protein product [Penicillium nalgiovense]